MSNYKVNKSIIKALKPCKDRFDNYLSHYSDFDGTILEFLELNKITARDKIWVACRILPRSIIEVFAIDCAFAAAHDAAYDDAAYDDAAHDAAYADAAYDDAAHAAAHAAHYAYAAHAAAHDAAYADAAYDDAAHAAAAHYDDAAHAAAYAAHAAAHYAAAAHAAAAHAAAAERENQVDALIMLIKLERKD